MAWVPMRNVGLVFGAQRPAHEEAMRASRRGRGLATDSNEGVKEGEEGEEEQEEQEKGGRRVLEGWKEKD